MTTAAGGNPEAVAWRAGLAAAGTSVMFGFVPLRPRGLYADGLSPIGWGRGPECRRARARRAGCDPVMASGGSKLAHDQWDKFTSERNAYLEGIEGDLLASA